MPLFVVVLIKTTNYIKETKREGENERSKRREKMIRADSAPNPRIITNKKKKKEKLKMYTE